MTFFSVNFFTSYSSRAKALTTRLPAIFSWVVVLSWESFSRRSTYMGRTLLANRKAVIKIAGDKIKSHRVSWTSMLKK
ncbi:hypothetical protein D3C76_1395700 [compost metagenome]